jgi:magnesium-transporting ATPase (P-type)
MITGDNMFTGVFIAKECGMIGFGEDRRAQLVITGKLDKVQRVPFENTRCTCWRFNISNFVEHCMDRLGRYPG